MPQSALQRVSTGAQIRKVITARILNGELPPGTRLKEMELAHEFATSQAPVREALRELEAAHLVVTQPYRGTRVREVSEHEMQEAYAVRAVLEELAGRLAAPHLKGATQVLRRHAEAVRKAATAGDKSGYAEHDLLFHRTIVAAAQNTLLLRNWEALRFELRIHISLARTHTSLIALQRIHWPIVTALHAGDSEKAGLLLRQHLGKSIPAGAYNSDAR